MEATKEKSSPPAPGSLTALRVLLCLLFTFLLAGTRAEAFFAPPDHAPSQNAPLHSEATGQNYDGSHYDALDSLIAAKKPTGSYTNTHESGKKYHGKGTEDRMNTSAKEKATEHGDPVVEQDFKPAGSRREAFKDEARRIREDGGVENPNNYNKINSPGEKYLKQDGE